MKNNFQFISLEIRHGESEKSSIRKRPEEASFKKHWIYTQKIAREKTWGDDDDIPKSKLRRNEGGRTQKTKEGKNLFT